ncbi:DUF6382 domain-containing protein [Paenibacillus lautus]|uniref:DUF6382 domain-containing protein n=1 Tax=Paenibacillus lautus TaxID=1401 RepID=UPI002DB73FB3|nr:DUF6382 domain-containing protein [Paenibacillus lautus]MEC0204119.1 DUF6382 domain-containing protein [Paenibacillus lautus]
MLGLKVDFKQNGGTIMVLDRAEGIQSSELNHVQLGMIRSSRIPHFLKLHMKEVDYKVTLEYDITGKKMLSQALKSERMTLTEYFGLLLQIVTALEDSKLYMLQPENYILHEDYLFIEGSLHLGTLYLTYVPVAATEPSGTRLPVLLKELMTRLLASVTELKGGGIQALMSFCSEQSFNLPGLKKLVVELLAGEGEDHRTVSRANAAVPSGLNQGSPYTDSQSSSMGSKPAFAFTEPARGRTAMPQTESDIFTDKQSLIRGLAERTNEMFRKIGKSEEMNSHAGRSPLVSTPSWLPDTDTDDTNSETSDNDKTSPVRTYILLGCLLAAAGAWRLLYMNQPTPLMLGLSVGITILLAAVTWLCWTGKLQLLSRRSGDWSGSLPMFESTELSPQEHSKWKSVPRFQADPLSGLLGDNSETDAGKAAAELEEGKENWRWRVKSPVNSERDHYSAGYPVQSPQGHAYSRSSEAAAAVDDAYGEEGDYYAQLPQRTEMLSFPGGGGATVLLSPETAVRPPGQHSVRDYLELNEPNAANPQRIELHQPHFIIGRSPDVAQFVAQGVGTSRAHVELSRESGGYVLKDLGSRNGTILKGESMVPYKEYPLMEGDVFIIAGWSFTLRKGLN